MRAMESVIRRQRIDNKKLTSKLELRFFIIGDPDLEMAEAGSDISGNCSWGSGAIAFGFPGPSRTDVSPDSFFFSLGILLHAGA